MAVTRQFVTILAADGEEYDALFHVDERATRVRERRTGRRTAQVHVHGIMGNFLVGTLRFLPSPYARAGVPMLVAQTRMGNVGQLFGDAIPEEAMLDLDAAVAWLLEEGYDSLILSGYSSGATMAVRFAATRDLPHLRGVVLYGAPWGLPESLEVRCEQWGSDPSYEQMSRMVADAIAANPNARHPDRLFTIMRSRGPTRLPKDSEVYTWRTWWHSRGPQADSVRTWKQIADVRAPILMIQGTADEVVYPEEAGRLAEAARAGGNDDVELHMVEGATHFFKGREVIVTRAVQRWLDRVS